jgi:hypothetical protein
LRPITVFETAAFNHSATSPCVHILPTGGEQALSRASGLSPPR